VAATPAPPLRRSTTPRVAGTTQPPEIGKGHPGAPGIPPKKRKKRECFLVVWVFNISDLWSLLQARIPVLIHPRRGRLVYFLPCCTIVVIQ